MSPSRAAPFPGASNLFFTRVGSQLVQSASTAFTPYQTNGFTHGTSAADLDCDGDVDLVEIQANDNVPSNLFLNNGAGSFTRAPASALPIESGAQNWQEGEFVDFDHDGDPDLYLGDGWPVMLTFEIDHPFTTHAAIRLWINQKDGSFKDESAGWGLPAECSGEMMEPLYIRDMNHDGWPDVTIPAGCPELGGGGILFNRGTTFSFFAYANIASYLESNEAVPADVDGDGHLDLLFPARGAAGVWVRMP